MATAPVLVTKPVTKVEKKPAEWVDQPEPQIWQRFVSNATSAYFLYRPAPTERLMPMDTDGMSTIGPSPSVAPAEAAESLSSWINVPSQIMEPTPEPSAPAKADDSDLHL
eukprot:1400935-Amphidinium_carterae.1